MTAVRPTHAPHGSFPFCDTVYERLPIRLCGKNPNAISMVTAIMAVRCIFLFFFTFCHSLTLSLRLRFVVVVVITITIHKRYVKPITKGHCLHSFWIWKLFTICYYDGSAIMISLINARFDHFRKSMQTNRLPFSPPYSARCWRR